MKLRQMLVIGALAGLVACDGKPPGGGVTDIRSLSIAGPDLLRIRGSETLSAMMMSGGRQSPTTSTWISSNAAVASVEASGRVTGVSSGTATITAQADGLNAQATLRVVPDYHGRWEGVTRITACADDGDFRDACKEIAGGGLLLSTSITQTRDSVTADIDFDGAKGRVSTTIQQSGRLVTTGQLTLIIEGLAFDVALQEWDTTSVDNQIMTGRYRLEIRHALLTGSWKLDGEFATVQKVAGTPGVSASVSRQRQSAMTDPFGPLCRIIRRR